MPWLHVKYDYFEITLKLFHSFTSHETKIKSFQPLKKFYNYFKTISATTNMLANIQELQYARKIISGKFPCAEIKLFQTDVGEGRNNFISHVTTALHIQTSTHSQVIQVF